VAAAASHVRAVKCNGARWKRNVGKDKVPATDLRSESVAGTFSFRHLFLPDLASCAARAVEIRLAPYPPRSRKKVTTGAKVQPLSMMAWISGFFISAR